MRPKILIVDDEVETVELIRSMLAGPDFEILYAYDGTHALELARAATPDLILLDVMLPDQDGWLVCAKLKLVAPSPKIIIFTALGPGEADRFAGFLHADAIMHKPFSRTQLLSTVHRLLDRSFDGAPVGR